MIVITCQQTAELLSRSRHEPLGVRRRLAMAIHVAICGNCQTYAKQLKWMDQALRQAYLEHPRAIDPAVVKRIAEALARDTGSQDE